MQASQSTRNRIICGDSLGVLPTLKFAKLVFADPPDNIKAPYKGFDDHWKNPRAYKIWLERMMGIGVYNSKIFWLSFNCKHNSSVWPSVGSFELGGNLVLEIIWRYTFGQHNKHDSTGGYRPMIRISTPEAKLYPDAIRVESWRQKHNDPRANPNGRVPDAVWEFPRVVGNAKERVKWAVTQHPQKLMERIIRLCCVPGDTVIDMFGHSFTTARVCQRLGINCISIEISEYYCRKGAKELGCKVEYAKDFTK